MKRWWLWIVAAVLLIAVAVVVVIQVQQPTIPGSDGKEDKYSGRRW
ncbi:hypothetical protein [Xanthomonas phaseoli]|nr:hypothetical protein [Xanthomonas phaseoli]